jgi:hypothetical protein
MEQTLNWYSLYHIKQLGESKNESKINEYIQKLSNKSNDKNVDYKINQIEKEYYDKLKEIECLCNNPEQIALLKTRISLDIIQKELDIIKHLTKYTLQKCLDMKFFISCLNVLYELSEVLRIRIGQNSIAHDKIEGIKIEGTNISRCSYKFCSYQDNCTYNYNSKTKNLCYQDHYVHNMVSADLKILIEYIKCKYANTSTVLHNKEILKTINTLGYVIGHMETELRTKCMYLPENEWEQSHVVKNLVKSK